MTKKAWTIYIIENKLGMNYCGICTNLSRRFYEHASNSKLCAKALRGKGPLTLKYATEVDSHSNALKTELWLKKQTKASKLKIIAGTLPLPLENNTFEQAELDLIQFEVHNKIQNNKT